MKKYIISVLLLSAGFSFASAQTSDVDTSNDNSCAIISSNLRYLSRDANGSTDVSILQDFLNGRGYLKSQPTGFFGSATRRAVIAFQNDNGLRATPPGFVGPGTRAKIKEIDCSDTTSVNTTPVTNPVTSNVNTNTQNSNTNTYTPTYTAPATQTTNNTYTPPVASSPVSSATIDQSSLSNTSGGIVTISGSAYNSTGVIVALVNSSYNGNKDWATIYANHSYVSFTNIPPTVSGNRWSTSFNAIPQGIYTVFIYDHTSNTQRLLTSGTLNVVGSPMISITASSIGISPAMTMSVQYSNMPSAGVRILNSAGVAVYTQELTAGGGGSTVVSLPSVLPTGNYTAQAFGSDGRTYATSDTYYFTPPVINYTAGSGQSITLVTGQKATDNGLQITLSSIATNSSGQAVANFNVDIQGYGSSFYSTPAGSNVGSGGGFSDPSSPTGGVTITVTSINTQNNSVTITMNTMTKG